MSVFHQLHARFVEAFPTDVSVPQPAPDFSGPGSAALKKLSGQVLGFSVLAAVLFVIVAAALIIAGVMSASRKFLVLGFTSLGCAVLGVIIALNSANIINWGSGFGLFG
jgi:type IV secretory pathway VirB2 component (pilin)